MAKQTVTLRLDNDDLTFLAEADIAGAGNLSEKIRALIADARNRREGTSDYAAAHDFSRQLFARVDRALNLAEIKAGERSELTHRVLGWLPEAVAYALSACHDLENDPDRSARLRTLEAVMAERVFGLIDSILQLATSEFNGCHQPELLGRKARFAIGSMVRADFHEDDSEAHRETRKK